MPLNTFLVNGGSSPDLTQDIINDTSKQIASTDYYDIVISGLKVDKQYVSQFRWMYEDGSLGEWSNSYEFTTDDELDPAAPSTPILVTGTGFFTARWNGKNSSNQDLTEISRIDIYVSGGDFNASIPTASLATAGTVNIAAKKGTYSVTFYAVRSSGKISNSSASASITVTSDSSDAATALAELDNKVTISANTIVNASKQITDINAGGVTVYSSSTGSSTSGNRIVMNSEGIAGFESGSGNPSFAIKINQWTSPEGIVIPAGSAYFKGTVQSSSGTIGGWTIGTDKIYNDYIELQSYNDPVLGSPAVKFFSGSVDYAIYGSLGLFGIQNVSDGANILFTNASGPTIVLGSSGASGYFSRVGKSAQVLANSTESRGLRNTYTLSSATSFSATTTYNSTAIDGDVLLIYTP